VSRSLEIRAYMGAPPDANVTPMYAPALAGACADRRRFRLEQAELPFGRAG